LTQEVYDRLKTQNKAELPFPLDDSAVEQEVVASIDSLMSGIFSQKPVILTGEILQKELQGVAALYREQKELVAALTVLTESYPRK
jgi:hypothetical protein